MFDIGRICVKIAGRDAGKKCVVIDVLEGNYVLIDGATRRRKCNLYHLEPTAETVDIKKNASHEEVMKVLNLEHITTKPKQKMQQQPKTRKSATKSKPAKVAKTKDKKAAKTAAKPATVAKKSTEKTEKKTVAKKKE